MIMPKGFIEFLKGWKFMMVIFVAVLATAAALIVYGVLNHQEPGLLGACWEDDEVVRYEEDGARECPEARWNPGLFPLLVAVISDNPHPPADPEETVRFVIDKINTRLGFEALRADFSDGMCLDQHAICIQAEVPHEAGWMDANGDAHFWRSSMGQYCTVRTSNTGTSELFGLVLEHEIGHCLGLAHDSYENSIMRAVQRETPARVVPPWITDYDRKLLRDLYNH
jgi:hypothetical protein